MGPVLWNIPASLIAELVIAVAFILCSTSYILSIPLPQLPWALEGMSTHLSLFSEACAALNPYIHHDSLKREASMIEAE